MEHLFTIKYRESILKELENMHINKCYTHIPSIPLQIMGLWYGSEIIMHSQDFPGVYEYDSCVIIHLTDVTDQVSSTFCLFTQHFVYVSPFLTGAS